MRHVQWAAGTRAQTSSRPPGTQWAAARPRPAGRLRRTGPCTASASGTAPSTCSSSARAHASWLSSAALLPCCKPSRAVELLGSQTTDALSRTKTLFTTFVCCRDHHCITLRYLCSHRDPALYVQSPGTAKFDALLHWASRPGRLPVQPHLCRLDQVPAALPCGRGGHDRGAGLGVPGAGRRCAALVQPRARARHHRPGALPGRILLAAWCTGPA
jgi:hypothetical protein